MDKSTSTDSSNIKISEPFVKNETDSGLQDEKKKTQKRPNSPTLAEESPRKKQKIKKCRKKKKIINRNKEVIDLDSQCGVITPPDNTPCTRSLNCKNHSLALKRSVMGRSQPYVILLIKYRRNKESKRRHQDNSVSKLNNNDKKDDTVKEVPTKEDNNSLEK
ncbi:hypothetical protein RclHR1_13490003 [Rhizophagus clarus]|uniref:SCA7-domain-containing protein n=1 Tax=Rhizophagus clarus TaxID=94130 RepID=A0A2Z6QQ07_9GLOM|nr:hypothetical protein RclHR1_13490003 [Rhizophagus clarus]GES77933.1 SCA7-domain-containing protein [Rhizophagus clarus]